MFIVPSVLWHFWLGDRKGIRPVKTEWWGAGMVIYLERDADLHMAQLMPLTLTVSCFSKIQIGFTLLVPAHPGSPGKRAVKWVCVYVCLLCRAYWRRRRVEGFSSWVRIAVAASLCHRDKVHHQLTATVLATTVVLIVDPHKRRHSRWKLSQELKRK